MNEKSTTASNDSDSFRMVALDLDGTLLQSNHQLADKQTEYLRTLNQMGLTFCIATGRAAPSVYDIIKKLALPEPVPVVCSNGARGFLLSYNKTETGCEETKKQEELFYNPVPRDVVTKTIALSKKMGYFVQYYVNDYIFANPITSSHQKMVKKYEFVTESNIIIIEDDFRQFLSQRDDKLPSKLLVRCDKEEFPTCCKIFADEFSERKLAHIVEIDEFHWLEILHPDVNKGDGLHNMCKKLDIPLSKVIAMGDGTNDIEFLQISGLGIAMNNAHHYLKKVANYTTKWTNDEHGVMHTLESLRLKGKLCCSK